MRPSHTSSPPSVPPIRRIGMMQPLVWLVLGWRDIAHIGWASVAHGLALAFLSMAIVWFAHNQFWLLAGALSGFMLIAPVLATSLYALSRALERGEPSGFLVVRNTWLQWQQQAGASDAKAYWRMVQFGALLACATGTWFISSAALITLLAPVPIRTPLDFVHYVVLARQGWLFEAWLGLGAMMAAPIFASSVIAMPLLLERRVTVLQAVLYSWMAVLENPAPMAFWACIILIFTLLAFACLMLGLVPVIPMLGHASWHAYRALIDAEQLALSNPNAQQFNATGAH